MQVNKFVNLCKGDNNFARTNRFKLTFGNIKGQSEFWNIQARGVDQKELSFNASAVGLPSKNLDSLDVKRFGALFKVANGVGVDSVTVTFICSEDMRERIFFEGWMDYIYGMDEKYSQKMGDNGVTLDHAGLYRMKYYDDYVAPLFIEMYGADSEIVQYRVKCFDAWPANIGELSLAWGDSSEVATFSVVFNIRDWVGTDVGQDAREMAESQALDEKALAENSDHKQHLEDVSAENSVTPDYEKMKEEHETRMAKHADDLDKMGYEQTKTPGWRGVFGGKTWTKKPFPPTPPPS